MIVDKLVKKTGLFYQITIAILIAGFFGVIAHYWMSGILKSKNNSSIYESSYIYKSLDTKTTYKEIYKLVEAGNVKKALDEIDILKSKVNAVEDSFSTDEFENFSLKIEALRKSVSSFLKYPKQYELNNVLKNKIQRFKEFALDNKWRRLSRLSSSLSLKYKRGQYKAHRLDKLVKLLKSSLGEMEEITMKSVLKREYKSDIVSRINQMNSEINMLSNMLGDYKKFKKGEKKFNTSFNAWKENVAPLISDEVSKQQNILRSFILSMVVVCAFAIVFFTVGYFVNKHWSAQGQRVLEADMMDIIENLVRNKKVFDQEHFSEAFGHVLTKNIEYANKRMSFGSIFQESLPIPGAIFDSNLKIIWGNNEFCDAWGINESKVSTHLISWDLLKKQTNLTGQDPILEAVKNDLAGIYQVKITNGQTSKIAPFDMYVRPLEVNGEKLITAYFYNLNQLQDSIDLQAKTIIAPIEKTLKAMATNSIEREQFAKNRVEFDEAGIEEVYRDFVEVLDFNEIHSSRQEEMIEKLEKDNLSLNTDLSKSMSLNSVYESFFELNENTLKELKSSVIEYSTLKEELLDRAKSINHELSAKINVLKEYSGSVGANNQYIDEILNIANEIKSIKEKIRFYKKEIRPSDLETNEISKFVQTVGEFEVKASKLEAMIENLKVIGKEEVVDNTKDSLFVVTSLESSIAKVEDKIIGSIASTYNEYKNTKQFKREQTQI